MKTLIHSLLFALILPPPSAYSADAATGTLNTVNSGLGAINQFAGSVGVSQAHMQQLFDQTNGLMSANQRGVTAQNAFNQTIGQLAQTKGELDQCIAQKMATKDTSKLLKAKDKTSAFLLAEPTCANYGAMIDVGKKTALEIQAAEGKLACLNDMQNKFGQIAEAAKAPFKQLTQAANESWNISDGIINIHKEIVDKITADVDGENGYRKQLADLKKLSLDLRSIVHGKAGTTKDGGVGTGLVAQAEAIRRDRNKTANAFSLMILSSTNTCFFNTPKGCDSVGTPLSPAQCIARRVATPAGFNTTKAARNEANTALLNQVMTLNASRASTMNLPANIDVKNPDAFLKFNQGRFDKMMDELTNNIRSKQFMGNDVSSSELASYYRAKMGECYKDAVNEYRAGLSSEGNNYKEMLNNLTDRESSLTNDAKLWIETTQQQMNSFRTSFNKVYNSELPQFTANCTASEDPYTNIECLKVLSATLKSGIDGTNESVKMADGSVYTAKEGLTTLSVSSLTTGANGKPQMGSSQVQCKGFGECINFLDRSRESHQGQMQKETRDREAFVQKHNKDVDTALGGVSATFTQATATITEKVKEVNDMLHAAGVSASVKTKTVEAEPLVPNETTKLYQDPKSMKAALASTGSFVEIDREATNAELGEALRTRKTEINDKMKEAFKKKGQCEIKKPYYEGIADALGECSSDKFCRGGVAPKVMGDLEDLFQRSQANPNPDEKNKITDDYNTCVSKAKSDAKEDVDTLSASDFIAATAGDDEKARAEAANKLLEFNKQQRTQVKADTAEGVAACNDRAIRNLNNYARSSRGVYGSTNSKIINALRTLNAACTSDEVEIDPVTNERKYPDVSSECEAVKKSLNKAQVDEDEGPSPDKTTGEGGSSTGNPLRDAK